MDEWRLDIGEVIMDFTLLLLEAADSDNSEIYLRIIHNNINNLRVQLILEQMRTD